MALLHKIGLEIVAASDLDRLLAILVKQSRQILGYDNFAIFLVEEDALALQATTYLSKSVLGLKIPFGKGVVGTCGLKKKPLVIDDVSKCSYYMRSGLEGVQSEIATPIFFGTQLLGVLSVESTRKKAFSREDVWMLGILGSQLGVAIRNLQQTRARIREMELLHKIGLKIVSKIELDELLRTVVDLMRDSLGYDYCGFFVIVNEKLILKVHSIPGDKDLFREIPFGEGVVGTCAERKEIVNIADVASCDFYIPSGLKGVKSSIAVPILFEGKLLGVLGTESRVRGAYTRDDERLLRILCAQIGVAMRNAEMLSVMKEMIPTDEHAIKRL